MRSGGMEISATASVVPERMANSKPMALIRSATSVVTSWTAQFIDVGDQVLHAALVQLLVGELDLGRQDAVEEHAPDGGVDHAGFRLGQAVALIVVPGGGLQFDAGVDFHLVELIGKLDFVEIGEDAPIALMCGGYAPWSGSTRPAPCPWRAR